MTSDRRDNHCVRGWLFVLFCGLLEYGGDCSAVASELKDVKGICGSYGGFAALRRDGTVIAWGKQTDKDSLLVSRLKGVKAIYSSHAFAAVLQDGTVEAWGHPDYGGVIPPSVKERLKQVQCISGTFLAFAALLSDGTVETWGDPAAGGDCSTVASELTQVVLIRATGRAFAALRKDGTVVSWGTPGYGGGNGPGPEQVVALGSTRYTFVALRSDGSLTLWRDKRFDNSKLKEVVAVRGTDSAFAALRKDGSVVTWGHDVVLGDAFVLSVGGGENSAAVQEKLTQVVAISSTERAFAALRSDGTVVTWGDKDCGGDNTVRGGALLRS